MELSTTQIDEPPHKKQAFELYHRIGKSFNRIPANLDFHTLTFTLDPCHNNITSRENDEVNRCLEQAYGIIVVPGADFLFSYQGSTEDSSINLDQVSFSAYTPLSQKPLMFSLVYRKDTDSFVPTCMHPDGQNRIYVTQHNPEYPPSAKTVEGYFIDELIKPFGIERKVTGSYDQIIMREADFVHNANQWGRRETRASAISVVQEVVFDIETTTYPDHMKDVDAYFSVRKASIITSHDDGKLNKIIIEIPETEEGIEYSEIKMGAGTTGEASRIQVTNNESITDLRGYIPAELDFGANELIALSQYFNDYFPEEQTD